MEQNANEQLLKEQIYWVENILRDYILDNNRNLTYDGDSKSRRDKKQKLSHPFYAGLSEEYLNCESGKRIMVVGQEARGYGEIDDGTADYNFIPVCNSSVKKINAPEYSQDWAVAYLRKQLYNSESGFDVSKNNSPFWRLLNCLKLQGFVPCWNNVDKVYFATTLSERAEAALSKRYYKDGETLSLLQREIRIAEPDFLLFVTGPDYRLSMQTALGLTLNKTPAPSKDGGCIVKAGKVCGVNAFWTNHPNALVRKGFKKQDFIDRIIGEIK